MASIDFQKKLVIPKHVLYKDLDHEAVLLNLNSEAYFGLDQTGNRFFSVLTSSESLELAFRTLLDEYEVDADTLRQDLEAFITQLLEQGLANVVG